MFFFIFFQLPGSIQSSAFSGCIGDVTYNQQEVGMFNFRQLWGDTCWGCRVIPSRSVISDTFSFDGSGYVSMSQVARYSKRSIGVRMEARTFWPDSLLLWSFNKYNGDYVLLAFESGNVVFRVSLEGRRVFEVKTLSKYNNNNWVNSTLYCIILK